MDFIGVSRNVLKNRLLPSEMFSLTNQTNELNKKPFFCKKKKKIKRIISINSTETTSYKVFFTENGKTNSVNQQRKLMLAHFPIKIVEKNLILTTEH